MKAGFVAMPTVADRFQNASGKSQAAQVAFITDRAADEFEADRIDFAGGGLDLPLDFVEREGVIGALVPVTLAVEGVKIKSGGLRGVAPVAAFRA